MFTNLRMGSEKDEKIEVVRGDMAREVAEKIVGMFDEVAQKEVRKAIDDIVDWVGDACLKCHVLYLSLIAYNRPSHWGDAKPEEALGIQSVVITGNKDGYKIVPRDENNWLTISVVHPDLIPGEKVLEKKGLVVELERIQSLTNNLRLDLTSAHSQQETDSDPRFLHAGKRVKAIDPDKLVTVLAVPRREGVMASTVEDNRGVFVSQSFVRRECFGFRYTDNEMVDKPVHEAA